MANVHADLFALTSENYKLKDEIERLRTCLDEVRCAPDVRIARALAEEALKGGDND